MRWILFGLPLESAFAFLYAYFLHPPLEIVFYLTSVGIGTLWVSFRLRELFPDPSVKETTQ